MAQIKEGDKAPSFNLPNQSGEKQKLSDFAGRWLVIYFYPKDMTTGCTQEAKDFTAQFPQFKTKKVTVLGVSPDSPASHQKFIDKYGIAFDLLADEDKDMCKAYGVWKKKSMYGREYMGVERTTFIIDPKGRVAKIYPKVKVNGHVKAVLDSLKEFAKTE